jgi:3-dehydroquinate synthase
MKEPTALVTPLPQFQRVHQQRFTVEYDYPVYFTERLFGIGNAAFCEALSRKEPNKRHRLVVFVDENVAAYRPDLLNEIATYAQHYGQKLELVAPPETVPGGEAVKNDPQLVERLQRRLLQLGIDRHSYVVAIGGGAMLDLIGYVAGTTHRGVRHVRVPTTVLAQNDSGVGVKKMA